MNCTVSYIKALLACVNELASRLTRWSWARVDAASTPGHSPQIASFRPLETRMMLASILLTSSGTGEGLKWSRLKSLPWSTFVANVQIVLEMAA
jgi:hypothetical protein